MFCLEAILEELLSGRKDSSTVVVAHKPVNFASIVSLYHFQNYWNFDLECKHGKHKITFRAGKVTGTFEKQAPGPIFTNSKKKKKKTFHASSVTCICRQLNEKGHAVQCECTYHLSALPWGSWRSNCPKRTLGEKKRIHHFHIDHNAPCLPQNFA